MIRSSEALRANLQAGRTIVRMAEFEGAATKFRWVMADTNEPVHGAAVKTLLRKEEVRPLATDLCGDPMQYGAVQ